MNNNIKATIVADSIGESGDRITSMLVTFPRFILAELNTHRLFSRNSASSRAIPFEKMVQSVKENPFIPIAWQKEHKGMQGNEYIINKEHLEIIENDWLETRDYAIKKATRLSKGFKNITDSEYKDKVTKQLCNRLLEPFMYHTVLITATEWNNFFELRCPKYVIYFDDEVYDFKSKKEVINFWKEKATNNLSKDRIDGYDDLTWLHINKGQSEIHMMDLAEKMYDAINESTPKQLKKGEWHIPFGDNIDENSLHEYLFKNNIGKPYEVIEDYKIKIAIARCARTSYTVFGEEKSDNYEADLKLFDKLKESGHFSPFEHIAKFMTEYEYKHFVKEEMLSNLMFTEREYGWCNNFKGFIQYRYLLENNLTI